MATGPRRRVRVEGDWQASDAEIGPVVASLLRFISEAYLPYLDANAEAAAQKKENFSVRLKGYEFNARVVPYRVSCRAGLRQALSEAAASPENHPSRA